MGDLELLEMGIERGAELGTVVGKYPGDTDSEPTDFGSPGEGTVSRSQCWTGRGTLRRSPSELRYGPR